MVQGTELGHSAAADGAPGNLQHLQGWRIQHSPPGSPLGHPKHQTRLVGAAVPSWVSLAKLCPHPGDVAQCPAQTPQLCPEAPQHHPELGLGQAESKAEAEIPWVCLWGCLCSSSGFPFILSLHWEEAGSEKPSLCSSSLFVFVQPHVQPPGRDLGDRQSWSCASLNGILPKSMDPQGWCPVLPLSQAPGPYPNQGTVLGFMILNMRGRKALQGWGVLETNPALIIPTRQTQTTFYIQGQK